MSSNNNSVNNTNGFEFMLYATLTSFVLANNLESAEQNLLGLFLQQIGSSLLSLSLYNDSIQDLYDNKNDKSDDC